MTFSHWSLSHFSGAIRLRTAIHEDLPAPAGNRAQPGLLELRDHLAQRHPEDLGEVIELRRREPVDIDVRILLPDVRSIVEIPVDPELRMMPALQQNLDAADGRQLVELLVELLERRARSDPRPFPSGKTRRTCSKRCRRSCS